VRELLLCLRHLLLHLLHLLEHLVHVHGHVMPPRNPSFAALRLREIE